MTPRERAPDAARRAALAALLVAAGGLYVSSVPADARQPRTPRAIAAGTPRELREWDARLTAMRRDTTLRLLDRFEFEQYAEMATVDVDYDTGSALTLDGGIGFRLWKALGAAVSVSRTSRDGLARIDAGIPHPFFDNRPRAVAGELDGVARTETGVHAQVTYTAKPSATIRATFSGGPSYVNVEREIVTAVQHSEVYPFDEATFAAARSRRVSASALGFNVGVDVAWMFARGLGVGGLLRYARASLDLDVETRTIPVKAGGLLATAGLRVQY